MRTDDDEHLTRLCLSQPELPGMDHFGSVHINLEERPGFSFSQPAHVEDLLLCTQLQAMPNTQTSQVNVSLISNTLRLASRLWSDNSPHFPQNTFQRFVRRMTRFFVKTDCEDTVQRLINCLENENYNYRINDVGIVSN